MSAEEASILILSDDKAASLPVPVVDLEMVAEETVELDSTPEHLTIIRQDSPQAVRPLSTILSSIQIADSSGQDVPVVPPIRADEDDLLEEEIPMNVRARSPGVYIGEADPAEREYFLGGPNVPTLADEEEVRSGEEEEEEEEIVGGGHGGELFQTDATILIAEGSSSQATPKKKGKIIIQNVVNVTHDGEVNAIGSIMTGRDLARIVDKPCPPTDVA